MHDPAPLPLDGTARDVALTAPSFDQPPIAPKKSRARIAGIVCLLLAAFVAVGFGGVLMQSAAGAANDRADAAERSLRQADDDADEASEQFQSVSADLVAANEIIDERTRERDDLGLRVESVEKDLESLEGELEEAKAAVSALVTPAELAGHRDNILDLWTTMEAATTGDDVTILFLTVDRQLNELVGKNVAEEYRECKEILANNGYASAILFASSLAGVFEFEPELVGELQTEIRQTESLREAVFDDACSLDE